MKTKSLDILLTLALFFMVVSGFAYTWQQTDPANFYANSVGMSADGRVICAMGSAARPNISTNWGQTWTVLADTNLAPTYLSDNIAISADGSKIFMALWTNSVSKASIYVSSDAGATVQQTAFPDSISAGYTVACSADGTKVIAASGTSPIFYSTNGGMNCYTSSAPSVVWNSLASSADGRRMVAAEGTQVYFSDNFGVTWAQQTNLPGWFWRSICISSDGKCVGVTGTFVSYMSHDFGSTWMSNTLGGAAISCSANGTNWLIAEEDHYAAGWLYVSTNGGATWQTNFSEHWTDSAMSADGGEVVVSSNPGGIWLDRQTIYPQINIQNESTNVGLSWLIPSTNFALQQTADLSNPTWTPVATSPTLNFTNLNQQVTVTVNGSNTFFRLIAQ